MWCEPITAKVLRIIDCNIDRKKTWKVMTHFYGFSNNGEHRGKLSGVVCFTEQTEQDCRQIGLISQDEFCSKTYEHWDDVPRTKYRDGKLGPRIDKYYLYTMPYDLADWMSTIRDDVLLTNVALPGSHDSGTAQSAEISGPWVRTQAYSVITQLILGIRVFDIRPMKGDSEKDVEIWTHHSGFKGERLDRILNCVRIFLETYRSETVIFVLSHYKDVSEEEVKSKIGEMMGQLVIPDDDRVAVLTVGGTRGRLLAVDENRMQRNLGPHGHDGTDVWNEMLQHLNEIPARPNVYNRFVTALTPQSNVTAIYLTPRRLAVDRGLPGLNSWLQSADSDKIGIVETDWFGRCDEVLDMVKLIAAKNAIKGNLK